MIKVSDETHQRLVSMARWGESLDQVIQRLTSRAKGLEDVIAGTSSITFIDGEKGRLLYRGYDINELAEKSNYEETTYLLWYGKLPTERQLREFSSSLYSKRGIPSEVLAILKTLPKNCDAMDALKVCIASLGVFDDPIYNLQEKAISIAAKVGTIVAAIHRHKHDQQPIPPRSDLGYSSNFLYMITGKEPSDADTRLMDVLFILHADHELNASTFAARVIASTLSDIYSAITGAVGALKGPLHGGANERVVEMVKEIGSQDRVEQYVMEKLKNKQKIMGFGHRVYRTIDPRARILKDIAEKLISNESEREELSILYKIEEIMEREKKLYPNVDLYSGIVLNHIGIPNYLFTPVFAVGRTPGWLAHIMEQYSDNRIIRPRAEYTGPEIAKYIPFELRTDAGVVGYES